MKFKLNIDKSVKLIVSVRTPITVVSGYSFEAINEYASRFVEHNFNVKIITDMNVDYIKSYLGRVKNNGPVLLGVLPSVNHDDLCDAVGGELFTYLYIYPNDMDKLVGLLDGDTKSAKLTRKSSLNRINDIEEEFDALIIALD